MSYALRFRQIHLDFHTGPQIPDVGRDFDADAFGDAMKEAHVDSVTVFAKCHHGLLYTNTRHPARHPGIKPGLDLLGEQVEALHRRGIRAPIYISVQCDEFAAATHPEWRAISPDGKFVGPAPFQAGWHIVDMSSPYQDYLAAQIDEVMRTYKPVDGLFLDMCWDQPSVSPYAIAGMREAGLDPESEADRARYAHQVALAYMGRYKRLVDRLQKRPGVPMWFNSRPLANFAEEKQFFRHAEIEALPTGGWGYMYFPINVRFVRNFGLPCLGMTGRFHKSWADFGGLKPEAALMYECGQMLAHGARCSVGDQLHPRGAADPAVYRLIGNVYRHVEACEPWCDGATPVTEIGVIRSLEGSYFRKPGDAIEGVVRALEPLRHQFDFVTPDADLKRFSLIIVPESTPVTPALAARLRAHVRGGGSLILCGAAAVGADGRPVLPEQGVAFHGPSPFATAFFRFQKGVSEAAADTDHVLYERGLRMTAGGRAKSLARVVEPYFNRSWEHFSSHNQTPPDRATRYAVAARCGRVITVAYPLFQTLATHGNLPLRQLIGGCIDQLLPAPLLRVQAPSFTEGTVTRQKRRTIVHLLGYAPIRRTATLDIIEEPVRQANVPVSLRLDAAPRRVTLQPAGQALPCEYRNGRAEVIVPDLNGHAMVVFED